MKFNPSRCTVIKMGKGVNRLERECHSGDTRCKNQFVNGTLDLFPENQVMRIVREANYVSVNVKIDFKYMNSEMFSEIYTHI